MISFLEREKKDWITEAKRNRTILVSGAWVKLRDYAASLKLRDMTVYNTDSVTAHISRRAQTRMTTRIPDQT